MEYVERKRWVFFGLPFTFTKYMIKEDMITVAEGFFKTVENDCYMYKVQDVTHSASLGNAQPSVTACTTTLGRYTLKSGASSRAAMLIRR